MLLDCLKFRKNKESTNIQGTKPHKGRTILMAKATACQKKSRFIKTEEASQIIK